MPKALSHDSVNVEFKVAAKTARLIGRESISSSEGAIIELVKNSYDADASACHIIVINKYTDVPTHISDSELNLIKKDFPKEEYLKKCFSKDLDGNYILDTNLDEDSTQALRDIFSSYNSILIADDGEGMTKKIIQDSWMTIGTNNKELTIHSPEGRVRTGAKGIGRFALDKLGRECDLYTKKLNNVPCHWFVNWDDFESKTTLNEVQATLSSEPFDFLELINERINLEQNIYSSNSEKGTLIHIRRLREFWNYTKLNKLYENLKSLLPPLEVTPFQVSLISSQFPNEFGYLSNEDYEDYDWKVHAEIEKGVITLSYYPSEYDLKSFDRAFFKTKLFKSESLFTEAEFYAGKYVRKYDLSSILPSSESQIDIQRTLRELGEFSFSLYFLKMTQTNDDREKFYYRSFNTSLRKKWLEQNGGIKIYRDSIRIRPYGVGSSFDWLKLDARASESPAAPSRKGQWRVRSHQMVGIANISRIKNPDIQDQSNREGLIENTALNVFQNVLLGIIKNFEYQRSYIASILDQLYKENHRQVEIAAQAREIVLDRAKLPSTNQSNFFDSSSSDNKNSSDDDQNKLEVLIKHTQFQDEEIDSLKEENKILRILASSGAMISTFAHDFKKMSTTMSSRHTDLIKILQKYDLDLEGVDPVLNPFMMIEDMENQDKKLNAWLRLTLDTLKQDRRKMKNVLLPKYFKTLNSFWNSHLESRNASLETIVEDDLSLKCFEIDLDCIFNNLISNSYEAFKRLGFRGEKKILISVARHNNGIKIDYSDTGPGLLSTITNPSQIFVPLFTTKTDDHGNVIGTGMGMFLVQSSANDLKGEIKLLSKPSESGFKLQIQIPLPNKDSEK